MMEDIKLKCKLGILSRPDGSAIFSEGETTVIAGVYGPVESKGNKALVEKACVEAHFRPKSGLPGIKDRLNESIIKSVIEDVVAVALYPRTSVVVVVQEMQNNGQLISCALNALCLALLNSGIDMMYMFAAVTCFLDVNGTLLLRQSNEKNIKASFMFVFDSVDRDVLSSHTEGSFTVEDYKNALTLCRKGSESVFYFFKDVIIK